MDKLHNLLELIADGRFHSGAGLGELLGVSRAKIWLYFRQLESMGLSIQAVKGRGYRLAHQLELLQKDKILADLNEDTRSMVGEFVLNLSLDSTNSYLMQRANTDAPNGSICIAEHQSAGKGRRGRNWVSPLASNVYLSVLWRFPEGISRLGGLSLCAAIAVIEALESIGTKELAIKWPNDIFTTGGQKVGGILLEAAGETNGPCHVVLGVGLNVYMPKSQSLHIDQSWSNLTYVNGTLSRNKITSALINHIFSALSEFQTSGMASFLPRWAQHDLVMNKMVDIHTPSGVISGFARGVDEQGYLLIEHDEADKQLTKYAYGEVSLRMPDTIT